LSKEDIGDIDGDGRPDVVIGPAERYRGGKNHVLAWYGNPGARAFGSDWPRHVIEKSTNNNHTVRLADIDGDGDLDLVTGIPWGTGGVQTSVRVYYHAGRGRFGDPQMVTDRKGLYSGALADVDGDGDLDIIGQDTYARGSKPWVYENRGR